MRFTKPRLTLAGMLLLVALAALIINYLRPQVTRIIDVKLGTGPAIKKGDVAIVHYAGTLADGKVFDESKGRGEPFQFEVGKGMVIRGWDVGLVGMQAGGVRRLIIPPEEAYGEKGVPPAIPPKATLSFEIELIGIKPGVAQGANPPEQVPGSPEGAAPPPDLGGESPGSGPAQGERGIVVGDLPPEETTGPGADSPARKPE